MHIDGYDEALCTPTETSALIALRTQQILQHETNVTCTVDPLGGSYFVENLTHDMEHRVTDYIAEIESLGGLVESVNKGWVHDEIADSAVKYQKAVESGEMLVVGVNCHTMEDQPVEIFAQPETLNRQKAKLEGLRNGETKRQSRQLWEESVRRAGEWITSCPPSSKPPSPGLPKGKSLRSSGRSGVAGTPLCDSENHSEDRQAMRRAHIRNP